MKTHDKGLDIIQVRPSGVPMPLEARMAITTKGQVTWANPDKGAACLHCRFFDRMDGATVRPEGKGRCTLVEVMTRKNGKGAPGQLFAGHRAVACGKFERGA